MFLRVILPLVASLFVIGGLAWIAHANDILGPDWRPYVTAASVLLAGLTFILNTWNARVQSRQQHTLKILFDTRLSSEFRNHLERRADYFKPGTPVALKTYLAFLNAREDCHLTRSEAKARRLCAESIRSLLNYYEFLCLGISRCDLDEAMLKGSIRGIMCNLVHDMREVIDHERRNNPRVYVQLIRTFNRWRDPKVHAAIAERS